MKFHLRFSFLALSVLVVAFPAVAAVKPHAIFGDHMVLQRNAPIPVWGTADPGEEFDLVLRVKVANGIREDKQTVKADKDGKWLVRFAEFPAATDGTMLFRSKAGEPLVFQDVAIGEVWVCSGQSNMEWSLAACPKGGGPEAIKNSANPMLRMFTVSKYAAPTPQSGFNPKPATDKHHRWLPSEPKNAPMFSAVAYYFGQALQETLKVPVGLIHTSWGGTPAQAWTSREALAADKSLAYYANQLDQRIKSYDAAKATEQYKLALAKWEAAAETAKQNNQPTPRRPAPPQAPGTGPHDPASLYNGMIAPLLPYAIKGAIWYQGESNAGQPIEYRTLFAEMITDWRQRWGHDFPFYCVQLAPFNAGNPSSENWAYLREAQAIACTKVKNAGVAVITDAGDLGDIHPQLKKPCGVRMAALALANTYGQNVPFSGPAFKSLEVDGNKAVVSFEHAGAGLVAGKFSMAGAENVGDDGKIVGFEIAGADNKFHPASATIRGAAVVLTSDSVAKPVHVRYGWRNFPVVNLFNKEGLPASPFRTDDSIPMGLK